MGFLDCCSNFLTILPDAPVPFLPAFLLGTIFAALMLIYLYKKETNLPLNDILLYMVRSLFFHLPSSGCLAGHSETDKCNNVQCVRCQKYSELQRQVGERWRRWRTRTVVERLSRVEQAVKRLEGKDKMKKSEKVTNVTENEREEEKKSKAEGGIGGRLKFRGKQKRLEGKTCSFDKNKGPGKDWNNEVKNEGNEGHIKDERENNKMQEKEAKQEKCDEKQEKRMGFQKPTLFQMDLPANPDWNGCDVLMSEQKLLKLNFELIKQEFEKVFNRLQSGDATGWKNNDIPQGHWCIFPLVDQGTIVTANCRSCPGVSEIILGCLPAMMNDCVFGNAAFSILYPDSHITPHQGPTNLRLRCHLGIKVPNGCWLEVAGQQYKWAVGETLLFDDSFTHSAHFSNQPSNVHSQPRAVLLLDFWHPDVSAQEKECLLELLTPLEGA